MLSQTKEQIVELMNKVQVLDFVINTLKATHKEHEPKVEEQFKRASVHKLKLTDELLRLNNAVVTELTEVK